MVEVAVLTLFPLLVIYAAFSDLFTMTIPNRVSLLLIAGFIVLASLAGLTAADMGFHALAMVAVFCGCLALFAAGVMGGGDAKLLTAASLWFGLGTPLVAFLLNTALIGGILTLIILKLRTPAMSYVLWHLPLTHNLTDERKGVPYGIAIAASALLVYPQTPIMQSAVAALAAG